MDNKFNFNDQDFTRKTELTEEERLFLWRLLANDGPVLKETSFPGCEALFKWLKDQRLIRWHDSREKSCDEYLPETELMSVVFGNTYNYLSVTTKKGRCIDWYFLLSGEEAQAVQDHFASRETFTLDKDDTSVKAQAVLKLYYAGYLKAGGVIGGTWYFSIPDEETYGHLQDTIWKSLQASNNIEVLRKQVEYLAAQLAENGSREEGTASPEYWVQDSLNSALCDLDLGLHRPE